MMTVIVRFQALFCECTRTT